MQSLPQEQLESLFPAQPHYPVLVLLWDSTGVFRKVRRYFTPPWCWHNYLPGPSCWDQSLLGWDGVATQCSVSQSRAGLTAQICAAVLVLATPCHSHRNPSRLGAHILACHLIQIKAGLRWVPSSALNSSCGKPLTLLHLVSNLNAFYFSIYYVSTLKMSTRNGLLLLHQVNLQCSQPTESQDLMQIVFSAAKAEKAESQPEGWVATHTGPVCQ